MSRARSLMDTNVLKVTALVKELEAQRDQLQNDISAAQKREEVRHAKRLCSIGIVMCSCIGMNRACMVHYLDWEVGIAVEWRVEDAVLIDVRGCVLQELRVDKTALEKQMEELQNKQIELDRIKYRAKLEVRQGHSLC